MKQKFYTTIWFLFLIWLAFIWVPNNTDGPNNCIKAQKITNADKQCFPERDYDMVEL